MFAHVFPSARVRVVRVRVGAPPHLAVLELRASRPVPSTRLASGLALAVSCHDVHRARLRLGKRYRVSTTIANRLGTAHQAVTVVLGQG